MKKKVLLTGASGTVGSEALKNLVKNPNVEIHVFDVPSKRAKKVFSQYEGQITVHFGDLRNREQVEEVCKNRLIGKRTNAERRYKLFRRPGQDRAHGHTLILEAPDQLQALVSGNAAADDEYDLLTGHGLWITVWNNGTI